jgi:hypothetical protein
MVFPNEPRFARWFQAVVAGKDGQRFFLRMAGIEKSLDTGEDFFEPLGLVNREAFFENRVVLVKPAQILRHSRVARRIGILCIEEYRNHRFREAG